MPIPIVAEASVPFTDHAVGHGLLYQRSETLPSNGEELGTMVQPCVTDAPSSQATAHPSTFVEHLHASSLRCERPGRSQTGQTGTNNDYVKHVQTVCTVFGGAA